MCFCGGTETPEHLFFSCSLAQQGFAWVRPLYHLASPQALVINSRIMLFGFTRDELLCVPRAFTYIINVLKYLIWRQRNDFRFRGVTPSPLRLIAQLRARVSFFLPLFFKRFRSPTCHGSSQCLCTLVARELMPLPCLSRRYNWILFFGSFSLIVTRPLTGTLVRTVAFIGSTVRTTFSFAFSLGECGRLQWQHCTSLPGSLSICHECLERHSDFLLVYSLNLNFFLKFFVATYPLTESQERTVTFTGSTVQTVFPFF